MCTIGCSGGGNACNLGCGSDCVGNCEQGCIDTCDVSCGGNCSYNCFKTCASNCMIVCSWYCKGCDNDCTGGCSGSGSSQNPNVAKRMSETQINKSPEEKQRILNDRQDTNRKRYGHDWYTETLEFLEAEKQGSLEKYGTKCYLGSKAYEERLIRETGSTSRTRKYLYYGQVFDSSWELALWIFAIDHNLPIYRCPIIYKFKYNGETYSCNPDFLYIDRIIEIKGDHFINQDDGKMYLPFRRKEWSDEKYKFICGIYEAKRQCLLSHNVTLWFKSDIQFALDYIKFNYGKNYLKIFKLQNPTNPSFNVCGNIFFDTSIRRSIFSYPIFSAKGISPYDINKKEKFHFPNKGVSPFDIGLSRISHD